MFAGNFAPRNWSYCAGNILSIAQNTALFSLLGTTYGGNGQTTFGLPDFRSRTAVGVGTGPGLSTIALGEMSGSENILLNINQIPAHTHVASGSNVSPNCWNGQGDETNPGSGFLASAVGQDIYSSTHNTTMGIVNTSVTMGPTGGNQPHNNIQPSLGMNYIICMYGIFPSRS